MRPNSLYCDLGTVHPVLFLIIYREISEFWVNPIENGLHSFIALEKNEHQR